MTKISLQSSSSFENLKKSFQNLTRSLSTPVTEPRDLSGIIKAYQLGYLGEQDVWLEMIMERIRNKYAPLFAANFLFE
jgi:hypothetical protein